MGSNGEREGKGTCKYIDKTSYTGDWKDNKRHGHGTFHDDDKSRYEGEWKKDKKHGEGKLYTSNGGVIEGTWEKDRLHGKGTKTKNGKTKTYIWYYDMKIDQVDQDTCCDRAALSIFFCVMLLVPPILFVIM